MWYIWFALAVVLSLAEILTPGFFLLALGIACLAGMLSSLSGMSLPSQILVTALALIPLMVLLKPVMRKITKDSRTNAERLLGRKALLKESSSPDCKGKIRLDGVDWPVSSDKPLDKGRKVVVIAIEGITLYVKEAE